MSRSGLSQAILIDSHHHRPTGDRSSRSKHGHPATDLRSLGWIGDGCHVRLYRDVEPVAEGYDEEAWSRYEQTKATSRLKPLQFCAAVGCVEHTYEELSGTGRQPDYARTCCEEDKAHPRDMRVRSGR